MHALARCWAPGGGRARGPLIEPAVYSAILRWRAHVGRKSRDGQPSAPNGEPHGEPHEGPPHHRPSPDARPRGGALGQVALVVGAWIAYSLARSLSGDDVAAAIHRGRQLQHWDSLLGFGWTIDLNHWVTAHALSAVPMTLEYASLHYLVTPLVLVWLWRAHPETYKSALLALIGMSAVGLIVYIVMPVAPPRLLPGSHWIDTMSAWSHIGWWGNAGSAPAGMGHLTDQYAAMPSLHVGWAVWCAWAWNRVARNGTLRRLAWIYPATVAATVVATANHYVLDVAAGVALALAACALAPRAVAHLRGDTDFPNNGQTADLDAVGLETFEPNRQIPSSVTGFIAAELIKLVDLRNPTTQREPSELDAEQLSRSGRSRTSSE